MNRKIISIIFIAAALLSAAGCDVFTAAIDAERTTVPLINDGTIIQESVAVTEVKAGVDAVLTVNFSSDPGAATTWTELSSHGITFSSPADTATSSSCAITQTLAGYAADEAVKIARIKSTVSTGNRKRDYYFNFIIYNTNFAFVKPGGTGTGTGTSPGNARGSINAALGLKNKVAVAAGTFNVTYPTDHVTIEANKTLYGGYDPVTWQRNYSVHETVIRDNSANVAGNRAVDMSGGNNELNGFTVISGTGKTAAPAADTYAVYATGNNVTIKNNAISCPEFESNYSKFFLICVNAASDVTIQNNRISNVKNSHHMCPLYISGATNVSILDNTIDIKSVTGATGDSASTILYGISIIGYGAYTVTGNTLNINEVNTSFAINSGDIEVIGIKCHNSTTEIDLNLSQNTIAIQTINTNTDKSLYYSAIYITGKVKNTDPDEGVSGNTVSSPRINHQSTGGQLYSRVVYCFIDNTNTGSLTFQNNSFPGPVVTLNDNTGTDTSRHNLVGVYIVGKPTGGITLENNYISAGRLERGDPQSYYFHGAGIFNDNATDPNPLTIARNTIEGPVINSGNPAGTAMVAAGIQANSSTSDGTFINIFNNLISGGSIASSGHADSRTCGLELSGSRDFQIGNNTIISGVHPQRTVNVFYTHALQLNAQVSLYNNIYIMTGAAARYGLYENGANHFFTCKNSTFVNDGSGASTVLVHNQPAADILFITETVTFMSGSYALAGEYANSYQSGTSGIFISYKGADNNALTLSDNNWRLSSTASTSVKTGGFLGPFSFAYTTDRAGTTRTNPWSMGAYEYE